MDPTKQPAETNPESASLESDGSLIEPAPGQPAQPVAPVPTPITASTTSGDLSLNSLDEKTRLPDPIKKKDPFFKRIWRRFNIYLLLFIVLILVAVGIVITFLVKDKKQNQTASTTNTQTLSQSQLQQLANSDTTLGSPKQTLNVESNAIFAGTVLVRQDLEVAGSIRVNGALALPGITVSGLSNFNQIQASSVGITGAATVQGTLTAKGGINVTGNSSFSGNVSTTQLTTSTLQLNGDLILTHHITGGGPVPGLSQGIALGGGGTASVSGSDTSGSITINTGSSPAAGCFETITFARAFSGTPHVIVTPIGAAAASLQFYVNRSSTSFSVCTTSPAPASQTFGFDYLIVN